MVMASVFFSVGIPCECYPTQDWEQQAQTCSRQAQYDANPDCEWHSEKHPKKASLVMAFVDVAESRNYAEQRCDFIVRMARFSADWC
jgi:hypothetical protein